MRQDNWIKCYWNYNENNAIKISNTLYKWYRTVYCNNVGLHWYCYYYTGTTCSMMHQSVRRDSTFTWVYCIVTTFELSTVSYRVIFFAYDPDFQLNSSVEITTQLGAVRMPLHINIHVSCPPRWVKSGDHFYVTVHGPLRRHSVLPSLHLLITFL